MGLVEEKAALRKQIRQRRNAFTQEEAAYSNKAICSQVFHLPEYIACKNFFCFVSTPDEIDTTSILKHALAAGKRVMVPRCVGNGIMEIYAIKGFDDLESGAFGILEPKEGCLRVLPTEIDFAIIPCISCTRHGERLGQGGGYYDRYMVNRTFLAAAVCRNKLLCDEIPTGQYDLPVDMVITETNVFKMR